MSKMSIRDLTFAALLAGVYAVLTLALPIPAYHGVQLRVAEALTVLPFLMISGLVCGAITGVCADRVMKYMKHMRF